MYTPLFRFGFYYKGFKFICEYLQDNISYDLLWFIYPYYKDFENDFIVFSDVIKHIKLWQTDIYNISIKNDKLKNLFQTFKEDKIFFSSDLCGTDFKQVIDFNIRR